MRAAANRPISFLLAIVVPRLKSSSNKRRPPCGSKYSRSVRRRLTFGCPDTGHGRSTPMYGHRQFGCCRRSRPRCGFNHVTSPAAASIFISADSGGFDRSAKRRCRSVDEKQKSVTHRFSAPPSSATTGRLPTLFMHPKIKTRPAGKMLSLRPEVMHAVANPLASASAASRHGISATQPASGTANHARHHVSRKAQA
jgi:hypothetical protein